MGKHDYRVFNQLCPKCATVAAKFNVERSVTKRQTINSIVNRDYQ